ncbi:MAG: hypothetical protein KDD24_04365, partial [Flavobacteriales bacterium]|nr:hypothetical protein [Flavobacteriales bacterium]
MKILIIILFILFCSQSFFGQSKKENKINILGKWALSYSINDIESETIEKHNKSRIYEFLNNDSVYSYFQKDSLYPFLKDTMSYVIKKRYIVIYKNKDDKKGHYLKIDRLTP